tara:strand:+ start:854 stop:1306 length:453 start_codon:yes stop_codon:yes gene_type:complete
VNNQKSKNQLKNTWSSGLQKYNSLSQILFKDLDQKRSFLFRGLLNTAFGYLIFSIAQYFFQSIILSLIPTYTIGLLFNYYSYSQAFNSLASFEQFIKFLVVYLLILLINFICLRGLINVGAGAAIGQLFCLPFLAIITYVCLKTLVYKSK